VGLVYGVAGVGALVAGGILGGIAISLHGLKRWIWWMVAAINVPNLGYVLLAWLQPQQLWAVGAAVVVEQFGYGFGFSAFMMYLMYAARGAHQTAHYAIGTGFMAAGMMLPGMASGWIQSQTGYLWFFVWVVLATIPAFLLTAFIPLEAEFGKRQPEQA
jgi:PAT family beta-lactamase induction signal transducer AmpG